MKNWIKAIAGILLTLKVGATAGMLPTAIYRSSFLLRLKETPPGMHIILTP